jgi:hypothetical protein
MGMRLDPHTETAETIASLSKKIDALQHDVSAIRRAFFWQRVWGLLKVALVVLPLIWLAARWLPSLVEAYTKIQNTLQHVEKFLPK